MIAVYLAFFLLFPKNMCWILKKYSRYARYFLANRHPALILLDNYSKNLSVQITIFKQNRQIFIFNFV
jgi:hypothetical protein